MDTIRALMPHLQLNPSLSLVEFRRLKTKFAPLSAAHTRAFICLVLGDSDLERALDRLSKIKAPSHVCGAIINRHDVVWKCDNCALIPNCCCCNACFVPKLHEGHSYGFSLGVTGTCDCGDGKCVRVETSCPVHRHQPEIGQDDRVSLRLLPDYIQQAAPDILRDFVSDIHKSLCDCSESGLESLANALEAIGLIMECHGELLALLSDILSRTVPGGHQTTHRCLGMTVPEAKTPHECKCTPLQCIVRSAARFSSHPNLLVSYKEIAKKSPRFGEGFYEAYFAFYPEIAGDLTFRKNFEGVFDGIAYQAVESKDFVQAALRKHLSKYLETIQSAVTSHLSDPAMETSGLYYIYADFLNLVMHQHYNSRLLIDELRFDEEFVATVCKMMQCADQRFGRTHVRAAYFLAEIFAYKYVGYRFVQPMNECVGKLMQTFRRAIEDDFAKNKEIYKGTVNAVSEKSKKPEIFLDNLLYRTFGIYLNKLVTELLESKSCSTIEDLRTLLKTLMGFASNTELDRFLEMILLPTLRVLTNACKYASGIVKIDADQRESLEIYYSRRGFTYINDVATAQLCLALHSDRQEFFRILCVESLGFALGEEPAGLAAAAEDYSRFVECFAHMLGTVLFNVHARPYLYTLAGIRFINREVRPEHKEFYRFVLETEVMLYLMQEKYENEKFKCLKLSEVVSALPIDLRANSMEDDLANILCLNPAETGYTINEQCLDSVNVFNHAGLGNLDSLEQNYSNMLAYLKLKDRDICIALPRQFPAFSLIGNAVAELARSSKEFLHGIEKVILSPAKLYGGELTKPCALQILRGLFGSAGATMEKEAAARLSPALAAIGAKKPIYLPVVRSLMRSVSPTGREEDKSAGAVSSVSKDEQKKRQAEIMAKFDRQRKNFFVSHRAEISGQTDPTAKEGEDIICGLCRESISLTKEAERPFGEISFISVVNIFFHVLRQEIEKLSFVWRMSKAPLDPILNTEAIGKVSRFGLSLNSCGHHMHLDCYRKYSAELTKQNKAFKCPICKMKANCVVPNIGGTIRGGVDLQTMVSSVGQFRKLLGKAEDSADTEYISYEETKEMYKMLGMGMIYLVQNVNIIGAEFLLKRHGRILGNLWELFVAGLSGYSRSLLGPQLLFEDSSKQSMFSIDCVSSAVARLLVPSAVAGSACSPSKEDTVRLMRAMYHQSILRHVLDTFGNSRIALSGDLDAVLKEAQRCKTDFEVEILSDCLHFVEKYIAAAAIVGRWEKEKCDLLVATMAGIDPQKKAAALGQLMGVGNEVLEEMMKLSKETLDLSMFSREIGGFLNECIESYEKCREKITDSPAKCITFFMHARLSIKSSPLIFRLIDLPEDYEGVILRYYGINCEKCAKNVKTKAVCLICGEVVCINAECCKNVEATVHAMYCNLGRSVLLYVYQGNLMFVSNMRNVEDSIGLYKNQLGHDVSEYLGRMGEKFSHKLSQYKLDKKKYEQLREIVAQGLETQALDSAASRNPQNCPIF